MAVNSRKALAVLNADGMLMRQRKTGAVVTDWPTLHNLSHFFQYSFVYTTKQAACSYSPKLLDYQVSAAGKIETEKLQMVGDEVIRLKRLRRVKGIAAMHETLVLPAARLPGFPRAEQLPPLTLSISV